MESIITYLFWAGTDFCVNMANLLGITYDEFNIALFLVLLPALAICLLMLNIRKVWKKRSSL